MAFIKNNDKLSTYEEALRQIRGVISVKIIADSAGLIQEIHVLAGPDRSPKQVVRDIESVFMVNFGVTIDHKKISVAQLRESENDVLGYSRDGLNSFIPRPRIAGVTMISGGRITEAIVMLEVGGTQFEGTSSGPGTSGNRLRLVSQATLMALENYLEGVGNFITEDVSVIIVSGCQAVISSVSLMTNAGEERLIGAAFVNNDEREAVVKATLAAVNRRLDMLMNN